MPSSCSALYSIDSLLVRVGLPLRQRPSRLANSTWMMVEKNRCAWSTNDPLYISYHDEEWGRPNRDGRRLFEKIILEGAQAGLSWITILRKRENYRRLFAGFDPAKVAAFDEQDVARLLGDAGIIRNQAKIRSAIKNAQAFVEHFGDDEDAFSTFLWSFVGGEPIINQRKTMEDIPSVIDASTEMSKALKKIGFSFIGPTTCYAMMQASGMVDDHLVDCFCHTSNRSS